MSHKLNIVSAPGTPLLERTAGELAAERPGRSHIHLENSVLFPAAQALARQEER